MNCDLIITTNKIKKEILLNHSNNKIISKTKILTKNEIKDIILGSLSEDAIYELVNEFNVSACIGKLYVDNVMYKPKLLINQYNYLVKNNLIEFDILHEKFDNILVINEILDDYILEYFKDSNIKYFEGENNFIHDLYWFNNVEDEIVYVAEKILDLNISFKQIKLVNVNEDYEKVLRKIFKEFNIPLSIKNKVSIVKTNSFDVFINNLKETRDISESIKLIESTKVCDLLLRYFNKIHIDNFNDINIDVIIDHFKNVSLPSDNIKDSVEIINYEDIYNNEYHYFLLGFNDAAIGKIKDEDYIPDIEKKELKIITSEEFNKSRIKLFTNIYKNTKNLNLSFSKQNTFTSYNPSSFIKDNNLKVIKNVAKKYGYSNKYNKIELAKKLDLFIKFGELEKELINLYSTYNISYLSYDNKFKKFNNVLKYPINLSFSSVKTYCECSFKYYVERVLKLSKNEERLAVTIGNVFHFVLSKMYDDDFDFEEVYKSQLEALELSFKEKFFLLSVKSELIKVISFLRNFDSQTKLKTNICEQEFLIENIIQDKVNFKGIIDNIKLSKEDKLLTLIDYKSGFYKASLDNLNHGFNLQLPSYLYLMDHFKKDYKVGGMYISKILDPLKMNEEDSFNKYKFIGYSTTDESDLYKIDNSYENSEFIQGLKLSKKGFNSYSKVLDYENFDKIKDIAKNKILETANSIVDMQFDINPKSILNENKSCTYCKYKDLCFKTNSDIVELENTKLNDLIKEDICQNLQKNNN